MLNLNKRKKPFNPFAGDAERFITAIGHRTGFSEHSKQRFAADLIEILSPFCVCDSKRRRYTQTQVKNLDEAAKQCLYSLEKLESALSQSLEFRMLSTEAMQKHVAKYNAVFSGVDDYLAQFCSNFDNTPTIYSGTSWPIELVCAYLHEMGNSVSKLRNQRSNGSDNSDSIKIAEVVAALYFRNFNKPPSTNKNDTENKSSTPYDRVCATIEISTGVKISFAARKRGIAQAKAKGCNPDK